MSRFERTNYFERLIGLHVVHATCGTDDRTGVMTIDEAIAWAEAEMNAASVDAASDGQLGRADPPRDERECLPPGDS